MDDMFQCEKACKIYRQEKHNTYKNATLKSLVLVTRFFALKIYIYFTIFISWYLLEKFWQISLYVTEDAIAKLYGVKFSQIEGNGMDNFVT